MEDDVRARLRAILGIDVGELGGAEVSASLPLRDGLVNRLIADRLSERDVPVASIQIHALDGDLVEAFVTLKKFKMLSPRVLLQIERQPRPGDQVLVIRWSLPLLGPLASLVSSIVSAFQDLPQGIRIEGYRLFVDIPALLHARGLASAFEFIRDIRVHTRPGVLLVSVAAAVPSLNN